MKTSYRELDYEAGKVLQALRTRIGLTQQELGDHLGITARTVRKWEAGESYPTAQHLKALLALAFQHQAWACGAEMEEMRALWKTTLQKRPLDERWVAALLDQQSCPPGQAKPGHLCVEPEPVEETLTGLDAVGGLPQGQRNAQHFMALSTDAEPALPGGSFPQTPSPTNAETPKTRRRRKWLLPTLIALTILIIIGSAGTLFFSARGQATDPTYPGYLSGHGRLSFFDPLSQQDSRWMSYSTNSTSGSCQFTGGAYHASEQQNHYFVWCPANGIFSNFAFEVRLTIMRGDCGGMLFRQDNDGHFYSFFFCENGRYEVLKYGDDTGSGVTHLFFGSSSAIYAGRGHQNKMAVVASGSTMTFYVNEQQLDQGQDSSYTSGKIALIGYPYYSGGHATDVTYSNARLWTL